MKRLLIMLMSAALLLSACSLLPAEGDTPETVQTDETTVATTTEATTTAAEIPDEPERVAPVYPETEIEKTEYDLEMFSEIYECEDAEIVGIAYTSDEVGGFSGVGYVRGVSYPDSGLVVNVDIPASQHYSITLCLYCETQATGNLYVNGVAKGEFTTGGSGEYECVMFDNIYLTEGETAISFSELTNDIFFDYVSVDNCLSSYLQSYNISAELCNSKASSEAKMLYRYLCECFGNEVITAQQTTVGSNAELDELYYTTGQYPAIRFGELMDYGAGYDSGDVELAIEWAENGGIVGYSWYWYKGGSCYAAKSDFDLAECINDHDVARLNATRLAELYEVGGVSDETMSLLEDIDRVAEQLTKLKDEKIPVLFRPLPEASNGEFWWGEDKDAYLWLWELVYARLSDYWQLDNLIWIWNAQDAGWYVGDSLCDIIGLDIYDFSANSWDNQSHINRLINAMNMCPHKPIAITECNVLPSPALISTDNAYWSFVCMWSGATLNSSGSLETKYVSEAEWVLFYNCSVTQNMSELGLYK